MAEKKAMTQPLIGLLTVIVVAVCAFIISLGPGPINAVYLIGGAKLGMASISGDEHGMVARVASRQDEATLGGPRQLDSPVGDDADHLGHLDAHHHRRVHIWTRSNSWAHRDVP